MIEDGKRLPMSPLTGVEAAAIAAAAMPTDEEIAVAFDATAGLAKSSAARGGVRNGPSPTKQKRDTEIVVWFGRLSIPKTGLSVGSWKRNQESMRDTWLRDNPSSRLLSSFFDDGVCGADIENLIERAKVLALAQQGKFTLLLCESIDRLGRDQDDIILFAKRLEKLHIRIVTIRFGEPERVLFYMLAMFAELERKTMSDRVRKSRPIHIGKGRCLGLRPFGFDVDANDRLVVNPVEAAVVRLIFYLYGKTFIGADQICAILEELRIPAPRGGSVWHAALLLGVRVDYEDGIQHQNGVLCRPCYVGERLTNLVTSDRDEHGKIFVTYNPKDKWTVTPCPAIVDRELYGLVQERLKRLSVGGGNYSYLFSGLLRCGLCDGEMIICSGGSRETGPWGVTARARCRASLDDRCAHRSSYDVADLQAGMIRLLQGALLDERLADHFQEGFSSAVSEPLGDPGKILADVARLEAVLGRLVVDKAAAPSLAHIYDGEIETATRQLYELKDSLAALNNAKAAVEHVPRDAAVPLVRAFVEDLPRNLLGITDVDLVEALQALRKLFLRIVVAPAEGRSRFRFRLDSVFGTASGEMFARHQRLHQEARKALVALSMSSDAPTSPGGHAGCGVRTAVLLRLLECNVIVQSGDGYRLHDDCPGPDLQQVFRCEVIFDGRADVEHLGHPVRAVPRTRSTQSPEQVLSRFA